MADPALAALAEAAAWLAARGVTPVVEAGAARALDLAGQHPTASRANLADDVDAILVFGGDGTLLEAAGRVAKAGRDVPLLGVNLGRLGFLTEVTRAGMTAGFERLLAGTAEMETRLLLEGRVRRGDQTTAQHLALNDIVVTRSALSRMIEVDVEVDGLDVCQVKADGLIVATATGSTAYNLSAGGPILHPAVDALVLTPIAPHTLTNRPLVLPASAVLRLRPVLEPRSDIVVTFDGQFGAPLEANDVVEIARSPRLVRLLRTSGRTHYDMLREKLQWGK
jgi:NAD+ kinase